MTGQSPERCVCVCVCAAVDSAGDRQAAAAHSAEAQKLAAGVLSLYNAGEGFFSALYPNGTSPRL